MLLKRPLGTSLASAMAIMVAMLLAAPATAQGICVECAGPAQVYSCSAQPDTTPVRGRVLQSACIEQIAKTYGHQQCAVRDHGLDVCQGEVYMVSPEASLVTPTPRSPERRRSQEPKTVVEMAKRTAEQTNKQIDKSARVVKKAAKSTWQCLSSFFSDC